MEKNFELLAIILASLSILTANVVSLRTNETLLRRLVLNQKKIDAVKNLFSVALERVSDIERHLASTTGYQIRGTSSHLIESLLDDYENDDTGF